MITHELDLLSAQRSAKLTHLVVVQTQRQAAPARRPIPGPYELVRTSTLVAVHLPQFCSTSMASGIRCHFLSVSDTVVAVQPTDSVAMAPDPVARHELSRTPSPPIA